MRAISDKEAYRHYLARKLHKLNESHRSRQIIRHERDLLIYRAGLTDDWKPHTDTPGTWVGTINTNGDFTDVDGEKIWCRHLAYEWLHRHKRSHEHSYHKLFDSQHHISQIDNLHYNTLDSTDLISRADRTILADIDSTSFGHALYQTCKHIHLDQRINMTVNSDCHVMSLVIQRKTNPDRYSIKLYDPNNTLVHVHAICHELDMIKQLQLRDFLQPSHIQLYFKHQQFATINVYQHLHAYMRASHDNTVIEHYEAINAPGETSLERQATILSAKLYTAYNYDKISTAIHYFDQLTALSPNLPADILLHYLTAKNSHTDSGLSRIIETNQRDMAETLVKHIASHQALTQAQKSHLLVANDKRNTPAIFTALLNGEHRTVFRICNLIYTHITDKRSPACLKLQKIATIAHAAVFIHYHTMISHNVLNSIANNPNQLNHAYALATYIVQYTNRGAQAQAITLFQFFLSGNANCSDIYRFMNQTRGTVRIGNRQINGIFGSTRRRKLLLDALDSNPSTHHSEHFHRNPATL